MRLARLDPLFWPKDRDINNQAHEPLITRYCENFNTEILLQQLVLFLLTDKLINNFIASKYQNKHTATLTHKIAENN